MSGESMLFDKWIPRGGRDPVPAEPGGSCRSECSLSLLGMCSDESYSCLYGCGYELYHIVS